MVGGETNSKNIETKIRQYFKNKLEQQGENQSKDQFLL